MINMQEVLNSTQKWSQGLTKINSPIMLNNDRISFVAQANDKIYSRETYCLPFQINGVQHCVARKGYRPAFNKRYSESFVGQDKYLIKFADGELRVCDSVFDIGTTPSNRRGHIVASAYEDVHYAYILLQGGGGGGAGATTFLGAAGGASGALMVACICVDDMWTLRCATGGVGGAVNKRGARGGDTVAICGNNILNAQGGDGGEVDGKKTLGNLPICFENAQCHCVLHVKGVNGGAPNGIGDIFNACSCENYGLPNESVLSFEQRLGPAYAFGLHGGCGGSSAFGYGGYGVALSTPGAHGEGFGAGGSGGGQTIAKAGGNGANGCIEIFV